MNILQILPALSGGGVETGTVDLAGALVAAGHTAVVVSHGGRLEEELRRRGARHYRLPVHAKSLPRMMACVPALVKIIRRERIDVVHARSRVPAWIAYMASRLAGVPLVTTCHGYYGTHLFSRVMGWGKRVIVISQAISRHMVDDFKVDEAKIRRIYRGVDLQGFVPRGFFVRRSGSAPRIGLIGRMTPLKGHRPFLYALEKVRREYPGVTALFVGAAARAHGDYVANLKKLVRSLSLEGAVEFMGGRGDVPDILRSLDLLVLPTTTPEAFGRVLIEAGAVGVPVVATRVGGISEVIEHEKTGLLSDPNNPALLAQAIITILRHPERARQYARTLQEKVRAEFSLDNMVERTLRVYEEARDVQRIAVIKLGALGDVVLIVPTLRALRRHFPGAHIEVIVQEAYAPILRDCPYIDGVRTLTGRGAVELRRVARSLRRRDTDLVVDLQNNRFSHLLGFLSGARMRYGYRNRKWGFLLNHGISDTIKNIDPVRHQFRVLEHMSVPAADTSLSLCVSTQIERETQRLLERFWISPGQRFIAVNAFASRRWQSKSWIPQRYAQLTDMIGERLHCRVVFIGAAEAHAEVEGIIRHAGGKPANLCGLTTLGQLIALLRQAAALVSVDSAAMHIAAGVGTPFVALFGPTDPRRHVPEAAARAVCVKQLPCTPCYRPKCFHHRCMRELSVDTVFESLLCVLPHAARAERV